MTLLNLINYKDSILKSKSKSQPKKILNNFLRQQNQNLVKKLKKSQIFDKKMN